SGVACSARSQACTRRLCRSRAARLRSPIARRPPRTPCTERRRQHGLARRKCGGPPGVQAPTAAGTSGMISGGMSMLGGIDLGGTKIQAAMVDSDHKVLSEARRPTPTDGGPEDVAAEMEAALRDRAKKAALDIAAVAGVGVGSPGTIEGSSVSDARNLPNWNGSFPLGE